MKLCLIISIVYCICMIVFLFTECFILFFYANSHEGAGRECVNIQ